MALDRRTLLEQTASFGLASLAWMAGLISPDMLEAMEVDHAFDEQSAARLIARLADRLEIQHSERIELEIPDVAENGAIVPISVTCDLDKVRSIAVIAEKNPIPLIGRFTFDYGAEAFLQARIKMAESSTVIALVNADNKIYTNKKFVEVRVGGCGT